MRLVFYWNRARRADHGDVAGRAGQCRPFLPDRVCDDGFCRSRCVDRGDRLYMYDRDSDYRDRGYYHRRPGFELYGPGFGVEVER